jgi:hypothetical protein
LSPRCCAMTLVAETANNSSSDRIRYDRFIVV